MIYKNFTVPEGDSLSFNITFIDAESAPDQIYFTVKKNSNDETPTIQKYIDHGITRVEGDAIKYEVYIPYSETAILPLLNYVYAIKVIYGEEQSTEVEGKLVITPQRASTQEEE